MNYRSITYITGFIFLSACAGSGSLKNRGGSTARETSEINTSLGQEYLSRGQYEIALEKLKKATNADSSYAPAHTVLAVLYEHIGEQASAEKHYLRAVKLAPDNGDVNNNYGAFLCQSGRGGSAEKYFLTAIDDPFHRTPAVAFTNAGSCELQSGNLDKAERYLRQSLEYDAEFADALLAMAHVSVLKGENLSARAFLQRYESAGPGTAESLSLGIRIESRLQNEQGANEYLDQLLVRFPRSKQAEEIRGELR